MSCKFTNKNLSFFLDDELPFWKRGLIRFHLKKCLSCQNELAQLKKSNEIFVSSIEKNHLNLDQHELWQTINSEISSQNLKIKWKSEKVFSRKKVFYYSFGAATILIFIFLSFGRFWTKGEQEITVQPELEKQYPIVESINKENVTVMTYLTDDPKIKIVWFFED